MLAGAVGLGIFALRRRIDWGLGWTVLGVVGLSLARPRWLDNGAVEISVIVTIAVIVIVASATANLFGERRMGNAWFFLISLGGVWAAVPDTESISFLLGLTALLVFASLPLRWATSSWWGGAIAGGLAAMVLLAGAGQRVGAAIGAAGALAVVALPGADGTTRLVRHLVLVALWSRVVARVQDGLGALALGVGLTLVVIAAEALLRRRLRPSASE
jgi:hypothetical protein